MIQTKMNGTDSICACEKTRVTAPGIHQADWEKAGHDRWKAFVNANPEIRLAKGGYSPPCLEAFVTPHRHCMNHHRLSEVMPGGILDHWHTAQVGYKEVVVVSQPYGHDTAKSWALEGGYSVVMVNAGTDRSWYFPGTAYLVLIGRPESVVKVNLEYSVSGCAPIPAGCRYGGSPLPH